MEIEATVRTLRARNRPPTLAVFEREAEVLTFPFPIPFVFATVPMDLAPDEESEDEQGKVCLIRGRHFRKYKYKTERKKGNDEYNKRKH